MRKILVTLALFAYMFDTTFAEAPKSDTIKTNRGELIIHFIGHGSLYFEFNKLLIYIDPFSKLANYSNFPKADLILVTHNHPDHIDSVAIEAIWKPMTKLMYTEACAKAIPKKEASVLKNGDNSTWNTLSIEAVPAYNIIAKRPDGLPFHPKGEGNGYIIKFGNKRVYIAGDTENIPEMKTLGVIDIAFIPMNLPYTMTPEQTADAATMVNPKILYPYHFGSTDVSKLITLLSSKKNIEVRLRDMK